MEKRVLHIVNGRSVKGTLRYAFREMNINDNIVCFPIDLSISYIPKDFSDKELCFALASCDRIYCFEDLKKFISTDYSVYNKVIVWHGWSARDLLLLYLMSVIVEENIYSIDIRESQEFMKAHQKRSPSQLYPDMDNVSPYDIFQYNMISLAKQLSQKEILSYREEWSRWANSKSPFRFSSMHTGIIDEYPESFMDESIIELAKSGMDYRRVVGNIMLKFQDLFIPDNIVMRRIFKLFLDFKVELFASLR